ncbi:SHOCT domain-containing protein [Microbacterium sp. YJN-G]|uniref:SHOCT domain-containing protein n=1 Tax=Microbacterium sp. YJN-G TaxID=2763257 RepID=UPI0018776383|nr:SHOCT domain-containing protein [Microbacterium sp. YJN-G]
MMWDYGYSRWMWIPGLLLTILIIAGIVLLIILLVRSTGSSGRVGGGGGAGFGGAVGGGTDEARRILETRLARGEITPQEFRDLLAALLEGRGGAG